MRDQKFIPILFSTPMVQAILNGTKKQTRRVVKPTKKGNKVYFSPDNKVMMEFRDGWGGYELKPKAEIGDVFWVRETTKVGAWREEEEKVAFDYKASPELKNTPWCQFQDIDRFRDFHLKILDELDSLDVAFEVDEENERFHYSWEPGKSPLKWKPSIFMPKEACRIFLKVTNRRVERLHDISEEDAKQEGIIVYDGFEQYKNYLKTGYKHLNSAVESFFSLRQSINGKESLDENPYVWVYDFEMIEKPENFK